MRLLIIGLLAVFLTASVPQAQVPALGDEASQLTGVVVDARTGAPLRRAQVAITIAGRAGDPGFTSDEGRFVITNAPRPPFTVTVSKAGFTPSVATPSAAQLKGPLSFALTRSVAVSGRVLDRAGIPLRPTGAYVTARLLAGAGSPGAGVRTRVYVETDPLGEYRIGGLAPGRYEMTALRIPSLQRANLAGPIDDALFAPPDSFDVARAVTVTIDPGAELQGVDFTVPGAVRSCASGPPVARGTPTGTARIQGRVFATTGEPLACAQLHLDPDVAPYIHTDADGRYSFDNLPAGSFSVKAFMTPGFVSLRYGQRRPSDEEAVIVLGEGERRDGVDIVLPREATVAGAVVDEHGEPVQGVEVWAIQLMRRNGRKIGGIRASARATDDRGYYRLHDVPPGAYLIGARATGDLTTGGASAGYVPSYYPGTTEAQLATSVAVDAGAELTGIDVMLRPVRTATVTGLALAPSGKPFVGSISMITSARSGAAAFGSRSAPTDDSGRFTLRSVAPGDYVLKAQGQGTSMLFGMQYVTVVDGDPAPAVLLLTEGTTLEGRLVLDVAPGTNPAGLELTYASADFDRDPTVHRSSFVREFGTGGSWDGSFRLSGVFGRSRLTLARMPGCDTCYLKSARVNATNAAESTYDFGLTGERISGVDVIVSDAGAIIDGRVADQSDDRAAFALVVMPVLPDLRYPSSPHLQIGLRLSDGRFEAKGLPPGEYIVAVANNDDSTVARFEPGDPDLEALLMKRGTRVTVAERERASVTLRLLRR